MHAFGAVQCAFTEHGRPAKCGVKSSDSFATFPMSQVALAIHQLRAAVAWADGVLQSWSMNLECDGKLNGASLDYACEQPSTSPAPAPSGMPGEAALYYQCSITATPNETCELELTPVFPPHGISQTSSSPGMHVADGAQLQAEAHQSHAPHDGDDADGDAGADAGAGASALASSSSAVAALLLEFPSRLQLGGVPTTMHSTGSTVVGSSAWLRYFQLDCLVKPVHIAPLRKRAPILWCPAKAGQPARKLHAGSSSLAIIAVVTHHSFVAADTYAHV